MNNLIGFRCTICGEEYLPDRVQYVCPKHADAGLLDTLYNLHDVRRQVDPVVLSARRKDSELNIFRYTPLLPIDPGSTTPPLGIGWTPLFRARNLERRLDLGGIWIKDETRQPTASLKDRASAIVLVRAVQEKRALVTTASSGNAGVALAGLAASMSMPTVIFVPQDAPQAKVAQLLIFGAMVFLVRGSYDAAYDLCLAASKEFGWYCRNTGFNPFTIEGKKTAAFEVCEQLGWRAPDRMFVPVGDGNIISGLHKGLRELAALGWIDTMPKLMGVQAEGASACYDAWAAGEKDVTPVSARTVADSICVSLPRDGRRALESIRQTGGAFIKVTDEEILAAMRELGRKTGIFAEPAAAAAYAGLSAAVHSGQVGSGERIVLLITGSGLKDVPTATKAAPDAHPIDPRLEAVCRIMRE